MSPNTPNEYYYTYIYKFSILITNITYKIFFLILSVTEENVSNRILIHIFIYMILNISEDSYNIIIMYVSRRFGMFPCSPPHPPFVGDQCPPKVCVKVGMNL